jgi:hypothetical protein
VLEEAVEWIELLLLLEEIVSICLAYEGREWTCLLLFLFIVEIAIATGLPQLLILGDEEGL